ncbi:MAG: hypothetical protein R2910_11205 [Gemmatimonadales bacterium]
MHSHALHRAPARLMAVPMLALVLALGACSSDEAAAPAHTHTPASAKLFVNDVDETANLTLTAGAQTRVVVKFYADDGDEITGIEADHFAALTFAPGVLATAVEDPDAHFSFDVTAQATAGTGTVMVGWGHDAAADELSFGPFVVTVP